MKYLIITAALIAYWYTQPAKVSIVTQTVTAAAQPVAVAPAVPGSSFAVQLAGRLGNPSPSAATIHFIESWMRAEGTTAQFNPLATSQDMPGATVFNSHGVKNYQSAADGLDATVITLGYEYSGYSDMREGIRTNDAQRALYGLAASPWGTSAANVLHIYNEGLNAAQPVAYAPAAAADAPHGSPFRHANVVMTQGYGVGSHAPAAIWGGIDLVVNGTPAATEGAQLYAIMGGRVKTSSSYPCGNGLEITHNGYRVLYCHLSGFTVLDGATVQYGDAVALAGSSGAAIGPHLHLEVWKDGANQNPLNYVTH